MWLLQHLLNVPEKDGQESCTAATFVGGKRPSVIMDGVMRRRQARSEAILVYAPYKMEEKQ